ncbi:hypothetical protein HK098_005253 [Nowakowskiella sp. JEL0407]|nr:hypothetical protein HK098_005253 [Nowakowskiella sp. JEL0407]
MNPSFSQLSQKIIPSRNPSTSYRKISEKPTSANNISNYHLNISKPRPFSFNFNQNLHNPSKRQQIHRTNSFEKVKEPDNSMSPNLQEQEKSSTAVRRNRKKPSNSKNQVNLETHGAAPVEVTSPPPSKLVTPPPSTNAENEQKQNQKNESSSNSNRKNRQRKSNPNFTGKNSPSKNHIADASSVTPESSNTLSSTQRRRSRKGKPQSSTAQSQLGAASDDQQHSTGSEPPKIVATPRKSNHLRSESTPNKARPLSNPEVSANLSTPSSDYRSSLYTTTPSSTKSGFYAGANFENSPAASALPIPSFSTRAKSPKLAQSLPLEGINPELEKHANRLSHHVPLSVNTGEKVTIPNPHGNPFWVPNTTINSSVLNSISTSYNSGSIDVPHRLHPSVSSPNLNTSLDPSLFSHVNYQKHFPPAYPAFRDYSSQFYSNPMSHESPEEKPSHTDLELRKKSQDLLSLLGACSAIPPPVTNLGNPGMNGPITDDEMKRMMEMEHGAVLEQIGRNLKDMLKISG